MWAARGSWRQVSGSSRWVAAFTRAAAAIGIVSLAWAAAGCGDESHGPGDGSDGGARVLWTYDAAPAVYYGSPALSEDETTVYFGTSLWHFAEPQGDYSLIALNTADGSLRWSHDLGQGAVRSTPAIDGDGSIYFVIEGHNTTPDSLAQDVLCKLSPAGQLLWSRDINPTRVTMEVGLSAPAIGVDGTVYVAGDVLYAIRPDGQIRWTAFEPSWESRMNAPVVGFDGTVYFAYHNIPLTALDPATGAIRWSCPLGVNDHCLASPAIGLGGEIIVATQPGIVYAVSPAGQVVWQFDIHSVGFAGFCRSSPAVDADGAIYFGLNSGSPSSALFALNPDGTLRWIFEPEDLPADTPPDHFDIYSSPAIGSDGTIYFGQEYGRVYALRPADGSVLWMQSTRSGITWPSPAIAMTGKLFIADLSGRCYAIATDSRGLKTSALWPKYRGDNRNRGRAQ